MTMAISKELNDRSGGFCELCTASSATHAYTVSPGKDDLTANQVALCETCLNAITEKIKGPYWRCLEGSIWNPEPAVQALSYRLLYLNSGEDWAGDVMNSIELDEDTLQWAMSAFEVAESHMDAFGNLLENGDTVQLIQSLKVKGTNFTADKGTVVRKIRLVPDNTEQIEGKINDQTIVILTRFVKKR